MTWYAGDRYKTDDGTVMTINPLKTFVPGENVSMIVCSDARGESVFICSDGLTATEHTFDLEGHQLCACQHGHLAHRLKGTGA